MLQVLRVIDEEAIQSRAADVGGYLLEGLRQLQVRACGRVGLRLGCMAPDFRS